MDDIKNGDSGLKAELSSEDELDHLLGDDGDDECGPPSEKDVVDDAIESLINLLAAAGYDDEDSEDAVFSAMEQLHMLGESIDTPDLDEAEDAKTAWIHNNIPKIKKKLRANGLDFED